MFRFVLYAAWCCGSSRMTARAACSGAMRVLFAARSFWTLNVSMCNTRPAFASSGGEATHQREAR